MHTVAETRHGLDGAGGSFSAPFEILARLATCTQLKSAHSRCAGLLDGLQKKRVGPIAFFLLLVAKRLSFANQSLTFLNIQPEAGMPVIVADLCPFFCWLSLTTAGSNRPSIDNTALQASLTTFR